MAVAPYASVLSLLRVIDNIQLPSRLRLFPDTKQIDALREKLCFLQHFLELHSSTTGNEDIECMARKIPEVTYDAESLIDNYVVDKLYSESYLQNDVVGHNIESCHDQIDRVIQQIESINEALTTLRTIQHDQEQPGRVPDKLTGDKPLKDRMVGFDDQLKQVLEKLTGTQPNLVIVPMVGMGGIGKTTLARSVFDHPYNLHHFHVRIWLTISQDYNLKRVLHGLLKDGVLGDKEDGELGDESESGELGDESESELITQLYQKLFGRRYLIVMDDVWSEEAWDDLKRGFPDNGKGSRVMVTTRLSDIASSLDSRNNNTYTMKFLDESKSWDLFSEKAFEQGCWSRELEEIGREISKRCKGLPLLLVLIGGLLASSDMKTEYWQTVAQDINSFANSAYDEYCLRILSLSYHHLPIHLKPCFLYMRHFDEDSKIVVSELIETWVSQGFVKPMRGKTLEEAARKYLEDLIGRNMLLNLKRDRSGYIKICSIHDLLRNLCIRESKKEQLLDVPRILSVAKDFEEVCFLCHSLCWKETDLYSEILCPSSKYYEKISVCRSCESNPFPDFARSRFVCAIKIDSENVPLITTCRGLSIDYYASPLDVLHTLDLLWNIEIFNTKRGLGLHEYSLPWKLPQLRHVKMDHFMLADPVGASDDVIVLENLQTLYTVRQFKCTKEIVRRIPNLRKLGVFYDRFLGFAYEQEEKWSCFDLQNLAHLQKLESLSVECQIVSMVLKVIVFPCSLRKLSLEGCEIAWEDLTIIGSLPNLQVLKLYSRSVKGKEWNPIEGEFLRLKYLKLNNLKLVRWRANETHFPALETLSLLMMDYLEEIPREIGELPSLNSIYLKACDEHLIDSAKVILEEQRSYGNERLAVLVEAMLLRGQTYQVAWEAL